MNTIPARLQTLLGHIRKNRLVFPIILFVIAPIMFGAGVRTLANFNPGTGPMPITEHSYALPKSKAYLSHCMAAIRAEHSGQYDYLRYLERDGARMFVFHPVGQSADKDTWVTCDANSGTLLRKPLSPMAH